MVGVAMNKNTMRVTVLQTFNDGTLADDFAKLGYPNSWKAGEYRDLPQELIKKVTTSGGVITIADDDAKESRIVETSEPARIDAVEVNKAKYAKAKRVRVMFPEGFKDGTLENECAALGHPSSFGVCEIVELPVSLLEKIKMSGGLFETDPETLAQHANQQAKHQLKIQQWEQEREQAATFAKQSQEATKHNQSILAEIETLSARALTATGKTKEALWQRINELHQSLR